MTDNTTRSQSAKRKTPTFYFSVRKVCVCWGGGGGGAKWDGILIVVHASIRRPGLDVFCHLLTAIF